MNNPKTDDLVSRFMRTLPKGLGHLKDDMQHNLEQLLQGYFSQLNLVTREEFDTQVAVLKRMQKRVQALETELKQRDEENRAT